MTVASPTMAAGEGNAATPIPVLLDVSINGIAQDVTALVRGADGKVYAPRSAYAAWRLRPPEAPPLLIEGEEHFALTGLPGVKLTEDSMSQRLEIEAAAEAFHSSKVSFAGSPVNAPEAQSFGAYLNYDLLAERARGARSVGGTFEAVIFTPKGVASMAALARLGDGSRLTRLATSWTVDSPSQLVSLRLGDSFTRGGVGGTPLNFGGVQIARNFATQPGFVTIPLPAVTGSAAAPSVVDLFVNNALANRREVEAGPFRLEGVPVVTGAGDVRLVVRDALGRESVITQSYYAASQLLRQRLHDFSYEIGFLKENFGTAAADYRDIAASATHRYGFTDSFTGEVHLEATQGKQVLGLGADILASELGVFSLAVAGSRTGRSSGGLVGLGFDHQADGFSLGAKGEIASSDYSYLGLPDGQRVPSKTAQAFIGIPTPFGSAGVNYLRRDGRRERELQIVGASASFRLGRLGNLHLNAQYVDAEERSIRVGLFLTHTLGVRSSISSSYEAGSRKGSGRVSVQRGLPVGEGWAYRASASSGDGGRLEAWTGYQGRFGLYEAAVTSVGGHKAARTSVSGTLGLLDGALFAARRLGDGFAQVRIDGVEGVRVYANNQLVGRTNKAGMLLVPQLQAYDANLIRIDPTDVPFEYSVSEVEHTVRPYQRSGVVVRFGSERLAAGLIKVVTPDGVPLPAGAALTNLESQESFVVAPGGEAYVTGLGATNRFRAIWGEQACEFKLLFVQANTAQQELGTFTCSGSLAGHQ